MELENGDLIMLMRAERSGFYINQSATMGAIPGVKQKKQIFRIQIPKSR